MAKSAAHLVFIPIPAVGHLFSTVEIAKLLLSQDQRLSVTLMLMKLPYDNPKVNSYAESLSSIPEGLHFVDLPLDESAKSHLLSVPRYNVIAEMVQIHKARVREIVSGMVSESSSVGVVVDMFSTPLIEVAQELGLPSYVCLTSGAAFLGLSLHCQDLYDNQSVDFSTLKGSDTEFTVSTFANRVPVKAFQSDVLDMKLHNTSMLIVPRWFRRAKGILVNTFPELEPHAIKALSEDSKMPRVYPVGPVMNLTPEKKIGEGPSESEIINWLNKQPLSSVVYLCFGSMATFKENQIQEIAIALENLDFRFLWSLPKKDTSDNCFPEGFLERTAGKGLVIGWAPQIEILANQAVGGFVSHCGWNSTLESVWFGVPLAAWPLHAEQHMNAFQLVYELGLAVEIKIDNSQGDDLLVTSEEIESGIRRLMDPNESGEIRENMKRMKEISRGALREGGSSYAAIGRFIEDFIGNST